MPLLARRDVGDAITLTCVRAKGGIPAGSLSPAPRRYGRDLDLPSLPPVPRITAQRQERNLTQEVKGSLALGTVLPSFAVQPLWVIH